MENFNKLEQIVAETIEQTVETNHLDLDQFFINMEECFKNLGFRDNVKGGTDSILLIRLDNVGDFILTIPAIREVRMNYPNAFITLVVRKMTYNIAELCPYVNEVLSFDDVGNVNKMLHNIYFSAVFSKQYLWRRRYDLAFSFRC